MSEIIAVCPYVVCNKVIFRKLRAEIETQKKELFEFSTICPHCKNKVKIKIGIDIKTSPEHEY